MYGSHQIFRDFLLVPLIVNFFYSLYSLARSMFNIFVSFSSLLCVCVFFVFVVVVVATAVDATVFALVSFCTVFGCCYFFLHPCVVTRKHTVSESVNKESKRELQKRSNNERDASHLFNYYMAYTIHVHMFV